MTMARALHKVGRAALPGSRPLGLPTEVQGRPAGPGNPFGPLCLGPDLLVSRPRSREDRQVQGLPLAFPLALAGRHREPRSGEASWFGRISFVYDSHCLLRISRLEDGCTIVS